MHPADCIFCQLISRQLPVTPVLETEDFLVINDIHPAAPVHMLVIPKQPITTLEDIAPDDHIFMGKLLATARTAATQAGIAQNYKLMMNVGLQVQAVHHLHLHVLGGWPQATPDQKLNL